jgi:hypothetical protein
MQYRVTPTSQEEKKLLSEQPLGWSLFDPTGQWQQPEKVR